MLDMRTIVFGTVVGNIVCTIVMFVLWRQSRRRYEGIGLLAFDFAFQAAALLLIVLRGFAPDWASMVLSNTLAVAGAVLGFMGLERFVGMRSRQVHNYALIAVFICVHIWFALVHPNLAVRNLNISTALLIVCFQSFWLLLHRVEPAMRNLTRGVGLVFTAYCALSIARIIGFFFAPHTTEDYLRPDPFELFVMVSYQVLFILLTYSLVLMVNKRLFEDVRAGEEKYSKAFQSSPYAITLTRLSDGLIEEVNEAFLTITGYGREEVLGNTSIGMRLWDREGDRSAVVEELVKNGRVRGLEFQFRKKSGEPMTGLFSADIIKIGGERYIQSNISDITERKRAEEERERLSDQLQQAMKMEAVGRLAGGVAHDFNNLITGITGNISMALMDLKPDDPLTGTLTEVNKAADSAASLTRQLLAFSRKQVMEPRVLNLNDIIKNVHKMLVRLIGEDIEFRTVVAENLWAVKADPGQLDQVLFNLAVNARDAMPKGGRLVVETSNAELDEEYCRARVQMRSGKYVMLSVSDTGEGMSREVKEHLFEPFFTTKPRGRGTGLGLATIYGIVKQSGGSIEVHSEVGRGTTFKIYLPKAAEKAEPADRHERLADLPRGTEVVLVVEDEDMVRQFAVKMLGRLGYRVLEAPNGEEALKAAAGCKDKIDLLLTDVIMPQMNGRELADRLGLARPGIKVLFTSGYTENIIGNQGVIGEDLHFIGKPYTPQLLANKLREVLDGTS